MDDWRSPLIPEDAHCSGRYKRWMRHVSWASMSPLIVSHPCSGKMQHTSCLLILALEADIPLSIVSNCKVHAGKQRRSRSERRKVVHCPTTKRRVNGARPFTTDVWHCVMMVCR